MMPVLIDEDEVLHGFAEVSLSEDELAGPPPRKRARLGSPCSEPVVEPVADPAQLIGLTNDEDGFLEAGPRGSEGSSTNIPEPTSVHRRVAQVGIRPSLSNYPKSLYEGWDPPIPPAREQVALEDVLQEYYSRRETASSTAVDDNYIMLSLRDFRIYRPASHEGKKIKISRQFEMEPLHQLKTGFAVDELVFDGTISTGNIQRYVKGVRFETMAIEGYGEPSLHSIRNHISIQSPLAHTKHVWYLLEEPSSDYLPYHNPFLWVADFAKHAVDYMAEHQNVSLYHFKSRFHEWLHQQHGQNEMCREWFSHFGRHDFRQAFIAYAGFLWKESWSVIDNPYNDPIWADINYISDEKRDGEGPKMTEGSKTVITPFVFKNFKHISQLTEFFEVSKPSNQRTMNAWEKRKTLMGFVKAQDAQCLAIDDTILKKGKIQRGDFVIVRPDEETVWKDGSNFWYAYIQEIHEDRHGESFNVMWLYAPSATTLAGGSYPFANELFFSGHCNCNEEPLRIHDIIGKIHIKWLKPGTTPEELASEQFHFFMRQKYDTENHCFVTLRGSDFLCACNMRPSIFEELVTKIRIGDPVLVPFTANGKPSKRPLDDHDFSDKISDMLEPVVVVDFLYEAQKVNVRRLIRRRRDSKSRQNELVWTEEFLEISPEIVGEKCHVRFFQGNDSNADNIPPPYSRNGSGNCWYITTRRNQNGEIEKLDLPYPTGLNEGLDPAASSPRPKMVGLDAFCGGGNFGRGIAEGMAVEFFYAIDWAKNAVHTYKANHSGQKPCWVYWGSVNDYLKEVMNGSKTECFANIGGIDFIAAGSPCQGFSGLQRDKASQSSLRNISMVASVAAFIDVYRPKYALLENVVAMAHRGKEQLGIFPQLLCTLVGMGYQVSQHHLDAWSTGDPQRRSRLFIFIAAPGLVQIRRPINTHSHPPEMPSSSLGRNRANDLKFGERWFGPTPFQYISVEDAMGDLPDIGDSHVQTCIPYPDHRLVTTEAAWTRQLIRHIPIYPPGQTAIQAIQAGVIPNPLAQKFLAGSAVRTMPYSRSWSRIPRSGLTSTITTAYAGACGINGRVLHWQQHRVLSIREARRAQGFDENDVIIGTPSEQWKIIGNSVSRSVALALGIALQQAWLANPLDPAPDAAIPGQPITPATGSDMETTIKRRVSGEDCPDELALISPMPTPLASEHAKVTSSTMATVQSMKPRKFKAVVIDLTKDD